MCLPTFVLAARPLRATIGLLAARAALAAASKVLPSLACSLCLVASESQIYVCTHCLLCPVCSVLLIKEGRGRGGGTAENSFLPTDFAVPRACCARTTVCCTRSDGTGTSLFLYRLSRANPVNIRFISFFRREDISNRGTSRQTTASFRGWQVPSAINEVNFSSTGVCTLQVTD